MKKIMIFMFLLITYPAVASVNCLSNSQHLLEDFDDKEWHSVACDCPCTTIKGRYCIECGHLQNAHTYIVVAPSKVAQRNTIKLPIPADPKMVFKQLAMEYLQSKK